MLLFFKGLVTIGLFNSFSFSLFAPLSILTMKNKLLFTGALLCGFNFTGLSQSNSKINLIPASGDDLKHLTEELNRSQTKTLLCRDTLRYPQSKEQILGDETFFSGFTVWQADNESISQAYTNTSSLTITGVEFFGARSTVAGAAATLTVEASIYSVDANNVPTTLLGSGTVSVAPTTYAYRYVTFTNPITVTGNYAVVLKATNANGVLGLYINNEVGGQSYDELLTRFYSSYPNYPNPNNWNTIPVLAGAGYDFEPLVAPIVTYTMNTTGTVTPTTACLGEEITFTNTTVFPQQTNRMLSYQAFRQYFGLSTVDSTYVWDLDFEVDPMSDGDLVWSSNTTYTYATAGTYEPALITLGGFWSSCTDFTDFTVTINPVDNATFSYASSTICEGSANVTPASVATAGGTFSSTAGLVFANATTGEIDVAGSTSGAYTVTYTTAGACPSTSTQNLTITGAPDATFSYAQTGYCTTGTNPSPVLTGSAGTFTASPAGLSINAATGAINLAASTAGTYDVTNTIAASGACPAATETVQVTVTTASSAAFTYAGSSYCVSAASQSPTVTGTAGTFTSSPAGLTVNGSTGVVDPATSTAGTYTVTNTVAASGACPAATTNVQVTITANPNASFSYAETNYCPTGTATPVLAGTAGAFTSSPAGLTVNGSTGVVNLATSTAGTYTITNTIAATATCGSAIETATVTIDAAPTAAVTVSGATITATETTGVTYQWINCAGNTPIAGETAQSFTATANGSYAVIVSNGDCSTTSACQAISGLGIADNSIELITVYPNPTENTITISGLTAAQAVISVVDVNGRLLIAETTSATTLELSVRDFEAGVYFIQVASESINGTKRFIKK